MLNLQFSVSYKQLCFKVLITRFNTELSNGESMKNILFYFFWCEKHDNSKDSTQITNGPF